MDALLPSGGSASPAVSAGVAGAPYAPPRGGRRPAGSSRPGGLGYEPVKRTIDLAFASTAVVALSPLLVLVAAVVKLTSRGPVIFRQQRLGRGGRRFWCYKFRTMVADAEQIMTGSAELRRRFEADFKLKDDPRVTPVGRFLRKSSLDELPQIANVLLGEISLIGPRPVVPHEIEKYGAHAEKLLSVTPGLSGYWQVYGRSDTTYAERVRMDMHYIDNRSTWLDLRLIVLTAFEVLRGRGAY